MRSFSYLVLVSLCACALTAQASPRGKPENRQVKFAKKATHTELNTRDLRQSLFRTTVRYAHSAPRLVVAPPLRPASHPETSGTLALQPTSFTPYDRYLGSVRNVIANLDERNADMLTACRLMREGRGFQYAARDPYRADPPAVTAAKRAGDCKSKALWLFNKLGDPRALYVIGKLQKRSRTSHAWVYWRHQDRWWILDPTDRFSPIAADSVSPGRYVPYYSYNRAGTYRHRATSLTLNASVAGDQATTVAGRSREKSGR